MAAVIFMHDSMAHASCNQVLVDRECGDKCGYKREEHTYPEKCRIKSGMNCSGDNHDKSVIDDLHDGNRNRIGS